MNGAIKICGIRTPEAFDCAVEAGASHIGFAFIEKSPRNISPSDAQHLAARSNSVITVALTVDASDDALQSIATTLKPALWQLHGTETPERVKAVRSRFGIPVMKVISFTGKASTKEARRFEAVADWLMFDAASGGSGEAFDWNLIVGETWSKPWFLAGGLTPDTVANAIYQLRPTGVDVSSGVEKPRGVKDCGLIASFISKATMAFDDIALGNTKPQS
ncbi:MAG: phosphoribosylanthranilate isomerase [Micropepsaceae bacterium]